MANVFFLNTCEVHRSQSDECVGGEPRQKLDSTINAKFNYLLPLPLPLPFIIFLIDKYSVFL